MSAEPKKKAKKSRKAAEKTIEKDEMIDFPGFVFDAKFKEGLKIFGSPDDGAPGTKKEDADDARFSKLRAPALTNQQIAAKNGARLWAAVTCGKKDLVASLLKEEHIDLFWYHPENGSTALHKACSFNHLDVVKTLIALPGADVDITDMGQFTPLLSAVASGNLEIAEFLLTQEGVDVNATQCDRATALHLAVLHGHHKILRLLKAHRLRPNVFDSKGMSPLSLAASLSDSESVKILLDFPDTDVNAFAGGQGQGTALFHACIKQNTEVLGLLMDAKGIDLSKGVDQIPFIAACVWGGLETVNFFLARCESKGLDVKRFLNQADGFGCTPIWVCAHGGLLDVAEKILSYEGVDVDAKPAFDPEVAWTAMSAIEQGHFQAGITKPGENDEMIAKRQRDGPLVALAIERYKQRSVSV